MRTCLLTMKLPEKVQAGGSHLSTSSRIVMNVIQSHPLVGLCDGRQVIRRPIGGPRRGPLHADMKERQVENASACGGR